MKSFRANKSTEDQSGNYSEFCAHEIPCGFKDLIIEHVCQKLQEDRVRYDVALVRANDLIQQTRQLKEEVHDLADDFHVLESDFEHVTALNARFKRAAEERLNYLDQQAYLGDIIAALLNQGSDKELSGYANFSFDDWRRVHLAADDRKPRNRRMSRRKRRLLYKLLCAKGSESD